MNNILNQLVNSMDKWTKNLFIDLTKLDLEHCEVELFNGKKYTKKLYGNDLFLFIDERSKLIGASIGAIYQKSFEDVSSSLYNIKNDFRKNRSGLEEFANVIIRVPNNQRIYKYRYNKKYDPSKIESLYKDRLDVRLQDYKNSKVKNMSKEDVINMVNELIKYAMNSVSNTSRLNVFRPFYSWSMENGGIQLGNIIEKIGSLLKEYEIKERRLENEKKAYAENNVEWKEENSHNYKMYLESITYIKDWYSLIK